MDPANERAYDVTTMRCHSCAAMASHGKAWADDSADAGGIYFGPRRSSTA